MRLWNTCEEYQAISCGVLFCIDSSPKHDITDIVQAGGIELVLNAMKLFLRTTKTRDVIMVTNHFYAIRAFASLIDGNYEAAAPVIQRTEVFAVIFEVMQEPFSNAPLECMIDLHAASMTALWAWITVLILQDNADQTSTFLSEMIRFGAIPTIFMSMKKFPNDSRIHGMGCTLLAIFASRTEEGATSVVVDGGRKLLQKSKMQNASDGRTQEWASKALEYIDGVDDCDRCHRCHSTAEPLMQCSRCMKVLYCCKACQKQEHKYHRKLCKQMASRANASS